MKSNNDRSKTINRKTTKNYHHDPLLLQKYQYWGFKNRMKPIDYLCIIVNWKYALPWRLVYNFGCLSLKIVKLAFRWRWIFVFVSGWHVAATLMGLLRSSSAWSLQRYRSNITQKYGFFLFWPGYSHKNSFLKRAKKKRVYGTLRFSRVYFNRCHPVDDTDRKREYWYVCKLLEEAEGQLPWLNQNLNYQNYRVRHIFRVQFYTGSLWLSFSF